MHEFLSGGSGRCLSLGPRKRNRAELGPEVKAAKVWVHDDQSNDFHNVDSSKL